MNILKSIGEQLAMASIAGAVEGENPNSCLHGYGETTALRAVHILDNYFDDEKDFISQVSKAAYTTLGDILHNPVLAATTLKDNGV